MPQTVSEEVGERTLLCVRLYSRLLGFSQGANGWSCRSWTPQEFSSFCARHLSISDQAVQTLYDYHLKHVHEGYTSGTWSFRIRCAPMC
jgi:hypothetical protein